jgi:hypothetical protein
MTAKLNLKIINNRISKTKETLINKIEVAITKIIVEVLTRTIVEALIKAKEALKEETIEVKEEVLVETVEDKEEVSEVEIGTSIKIEEETVEVITKNDKVFKILYKIV